MQPNPPPHVERRVDPLGDGTLASVITDPVAVVRQTPIRAWSDQDGRTTFAPDTAVLPPHIVDAHGRWDVSSYVALLGAAITAQAQQIVDLKSQVDALIKLVTTLEPN